MKYLYKFKLYEAIIQPKTDLVNSFISELEINMSFDDIVNVGNKYDIEVVDYDTFYKELSGINKKTAPPKGNWIFALLNPETGNPRLVLPNKRHKLVWMEINQIRHMMEHETIHVIQKSKRNIDIRNLPDPKNQKEYFSNKDEIMAFSQSIVDMALRENPKTLNFSIRKAYEQGLYKTIKKSVDESVLNKYKKYIYLYLKNHFEKKYKSNL